MPIYMTGFMLMVTKIQAQYLTRICLAIHTALALTFLTAQIKQKYGTRVSVAFVVVTASQFHLMFWGSRFLANVLALIPFIYALGLHITQSHRYKSFAACVFRSEIAPLGASMILFSCSSFKFLDYTYQT
jgi:alpha-1,6-mannosyltransferase